MPRFKNFFLEEGRKAVIVNLDDVCYATYHGGPAENKTLVTFTSGQQVILAVHYGVFSNMLEELNS